LAITSHLLIFNFYSVWEDAGTRKMKTMKALRFEKYGPPSVLSIRELPVPDLKTGEALVELHASAINPSDVKNVAGVFKASLPRIPGRDFAGVVVAGDGWKGKEVWAAERDSAFGAMARMHNISSSVWTGSPRSRRSFPW
jgi:NADPH:quinone reductase-like Zn-dependent oxidoreductase